MDLRLLTYRSRPPPICFHPRPNPPHRPFLPLLPSSLAASPRPPLRSQARLLPPQASAGRDPDGGDVPDSPSAASSGGSGVESAVSSLSTALSADLSSASSSIWKQMMEILVFFGPAIGIWISSPLMGLIDTIVIGQGSSLELAAMGPGTVFCDNLCYIFMFLSVATSNLVATSLAKKDKRLAQRQISILLFIALVCGLGMILFTKLPGKRVISAFVGSANLHIVPAADSYIQIRSYAWPAHLVGMVAQSASLAMKDPWGPLKALTVATAINGFGDIFLCRVCGYGIAGAAWATMFSQVVSAFIMVDNLNKSGFRTFSVSVPSLGEFLQIFSISLPVCITMASKVVFYSLLVYSATAMGTITIAAHQVMINTFCTCTVFGEPLSQTAQSFMPELLYGVNRSLDKARMLLKSLFTIGAITGLVLGIAGTSVPWHFPHIFTTDNMIIGEMHKILLPYFLALMVTPPTHSLEGTLLAGRNFKYLCVSMSACLCAAALLLMLLYRQGFGLAGCWWALVGFQWTRFLLALQRLLSRRGMLYCEEYYQNESAKLHNI